MCSPTVLLLIISSIYIEVQAQLAPFDLQVEYLTTPIGVDVPNPRFSWTLGHNSRGEAQQAYHILVSTQPDVTEGDMWNSGVVLSSSTAQNNYAGKPLASDTTYYWKVRWWDSQMQRSNFSEVSSFDTGFFDSSDWTAMWITGQNQLRREFNLTSEVVRARLFICGLGYYVAWMNGNRVGDHRLGPFTTFEQTVLYDVYDVTSLVQSGQNAIAVSLGKGWYAQSTINSGNISLLAQLNIQSKDGSKVVIGTDTVMWKTAPGPIIFNDIYIGEVYDARLETPGWDKPNFDDSAWDFAGVVSPPKGKLVAQLIPPIRILETFTPVSMTEPLPGIYVFDMGQNIAGWCILKVTGLKGTNITLQHSEMINENGTVVNLYINSPMIDTYILKGEGLEVYSPTFTFHGFQYVQVTGWPGTPTLDIISSVFMHTDVKQPGQLVFSDQDALLTKIQKITRYAALSNLLNIPTDCPQRERRGWLGDSQITAETQIYNFYMAPVYTKFLRDIRDSQVQLNRAGIIPDVAPFYRHGGVPADPAWGAAYTLLWYYMYVYYGDVQILNQYYDDVKEYIDTVVAEIDSTTGLLMWSRYGDWCSVSGYQASPIVSSFYLILQLQKFSFVANLLSKQSDAEYYSAIATSAKHQWHRVFYNTTTQTYLHGSQTDLILSLVIGAVPDFIKSDIQRQLLDNILGKDNHLDTGIVGTRYLFPLLTFLGQTNLSYTMLTQTTYPSYGYMVENGATTLWENWKSWRYRSFGSRNHIMFGSQSHYIYDAFAGISQNESSVAFKNIVIHPRILELSSQQNYASATIMSINGAIQSTWQISTMSLKMNVIIPVNSVADVFIPKLWSQTSIYESGTTVWTNGQFIPGVKGISGAYDDGQNIVFFIGSGNYIFMSL